HDVEGEERLELTGVDARDAPVVPAPGAVHENVDAPRRGPRRVDERHAIGFARHVARRDDGAPAVVAIDLVGKALELFAVPAVEHDHGAAPRPSARQRRADPAGGSSDDDRGIHRLSSPMLYSITRRGGT